MFADHSVAVPHDGGIAPCPRIRAPEAHPFHLLLPQEIPGLRRYALTLTRDWHRAQDLVQETMAKAWSSRARYVAGTNLRAWLNTILRNTFLSDIRKRRREDEDPDGMLTARLTQPPSQDHAVALTELIAAMMSLPRQQREALALVGGAGFSVAEAAARLDCAIGTVKSRASRARAALYVMLVPDHTHRAARRPGVAHSRNKTSSTSAEPARAASTNLAPTPIPAIRSRVRILQSHSAKVHSNTFRANL